MLEQDALKEYIDTLPEEDPMRDLLSPMVIDEKGQAFIASIKAGQIPEKYPYGYEFGYLDDPDNFQQFFQQSSASFALRQACQSLCMYAVVDREWTPHLAKWIGNRRVLEVMAGRGILAKALSDEGVAITATDYNTYWEPFHPITEIDAREAAAESSDDVLLISWPPFEDTAIVDVCNAWGTERPIIFIGEFRGCTGCDKFFDRFVPREDVYIPLPQFMGIKDNVYIGYWT
ncbi:hypothetical protein [Neptuniibacter sp. QD37_11]|uniref:hypothetical protein n=1 Tax=Neptuniibacter sp. QD37_11 TaxID=3398209 RepID=UPI0039F5F46F